MRQGKEANRKQSRTRGEVDDRRVFFFFGKVLYKRFLKKWPIYGTRSKIQFGKLYTIKNY